MYELGTKPIVLSIVYHNMAQYQLTHLHGHSHEMTTDCEVLVTRALQSPLVQSLLQGLEDRGCQFDLVRHVVCEPCQPGLAGG